MSKNYAFFRLSKLKSQQKLNVAYSHNMRLYDVKNADHSIQNEELVRTSLGTYSDMQREALLEMKAQGVPQRTIRKDAVRGFEIVLSMSEAIPQSQMEAWKEANVKWLNDTFNPRNHEAVFLNAEGERCTATTNNVRHVVVHNDEKVPHIHAFIVPIDDKGHLNAKFFTPGKNAMREMQTSYAKAMKQFGLSRGVKGTVSTHQDIQYYYAKQQEVINAELPPVLPGESAEEYKQKADEVYRAALANYDRISAELKQERNERQGQDKRLNYILDLGDEDEIVRELKEVKRFKEGVKKHPDKEKAEEAQKLYFTFVDWEYENEKKKKKEGEIVSSR